VYYLFDAYFILDLSTEKILHDAIKNFEILSEFRVREETLFFKACYSHNKNFGSPKARWREVRTFSDFSNALPLLKENLFLEFIPTLCNSSPWTDNPKSFSRVQPNA
jgi:hypothetical protein